jgi:hypothetical protein
MRIQVCNGALRDLTLDASAVATMMVALIAAVLHL